MLPVADAECLLGGASLHQGKLLKTDNFQLGVKDVPTRLGRLESDPYSKCLKWLHDQRVVLWDEDGKRGWLISGVCALLHLLHAYIVFMDEGDFGSEFPLDSDSLKESMNTYSARAAIGVGLFRARTRERPCRCSFYTDARRRKELDRSHTVD